MFVVGFTKMHILGVYSKFGILLLLMAVTGCRFDKFQWDLLLLWPLPLQDVLFLSTVTGNPPGGSAWRQGIRLADAPGGCAWRKRQADPPGGCMNRVADQNGPAQASRNPGCG